MSGTSTPGSAGQQQQPKQMSSRLLTMKFMQRAAASSPTQPQQTPTRSSNPYSSQDQPSAKRQKLDSSASSTPVASGQTPREFADRLAINAALQAEADARAAARARNLHEGGETEWVLHLHLPVTNGHHSPVEAVPEDEHLWSSRSTGRQTYGAFKRRKPTTETPNGKEHTTTPAKGNSVANDADLSSRSDADSGDSSDEDGEISSSPPHQKHQSNTSKSRENTNRNFDPRNQSSSNKKKRNKASPSSYDDDPTAARRLDSMNLSHLSSLSGSPGSPSGAASGGSRFVGLRGPDHKGGGGGGGGRSKYGKSKKKRKVR